MVMMTTEWSEMTVTNPSQTAGWKWTLSANKKKQNSPVSLDWNSWRFVFRLEVPP
jgi:hypothetical protein